MGVFSDNPSPAPFNTGPVMTRPTPGIQMGPSAAPSKPMDIRGQANQARQRGQQRQMMWKQMVSGTARSAGLRLIQHRDIIGKLVDKVLYGASS